MYHELNNYKMYLRLKKDCDVVIKSLKNVLQMHESYMMSSESKTLFSTVQVGILLKGIELTAKAFISTLTEDIQLYTERFEYGLDLRD